ncbi:GNAT family N-acetyltransferase [Legionella jamestowniensis]|uniref:N-acetyltransferase GCN5 n=1 Tax=Legionella jamestowniensis TaxID=455 RepID=A0A0W0UHF9_9GAMM|nr:GNAT family N-acetyltransferase [Legionella jamestowniensis]KTD07078.1 N-acetyltransferase GCN5 [Legionella jamestowniensis]SFL70596.1 Acetyltransferase (GNAT) domain-containing protein [Legionella jamestowniensis DSM 19215]
MTEEQEEYVIEQLGKHNRKNFSCGRIELDRYLQTQASQDIKKNMSATYVLTEQVGNTVLGYYSISTIGVFPGELPEDLIKRLPKYPLVPGVLLGRLAVDEKYKGKGLGGLLLVDALKRSLAVSKQIGINTIIVQAKDNNAIKFYKHYGFIAFPENKFKLFLPLKTIQELLE